MDVSELQPTLTGDTLVLRPLAATDFEPLYACASDPRIWELHPEPTRHERDVFRRFFEGGLASGGALIVVEKRSREIIGSSRYYELSLEARSVKVGYTFLARRCWGGVVNREMKGLMLRHAFQFVDRVLFDVGPRNWRSRRALEKLGATLVHAPAVDDAHARAVYAIEKQAAATG